MEPAQGSTSGGGGGSALRRWGPLGLIAAVAVVVVIVVVSSGGDDDEGTGVATPTAAGDDEADADPSDEPSATDPADQPDATDPGDPPVDTGLPDGVLDFATARDLGVDVDFGERCDPETGRLRLPWFFAPVCYAPFVGDNGGATAPGVTGDSITIVFWQSQDTDPVLNYITDAIVNDDTNADVEHTLRALLRYYETYYETYGRSVDLVFFEGSGTIIDEVSARADAVQIAEEIDPFMVWGGPTLTNAFAEELAARGIPCIGCGPGQLYDFYAENAPNMWALGQGPQQTNLLVAEFVAKQLAGLPAEHAGDPDMTARERVFGRLWIEASRNSPLLHAEFEQNLQSLGVELATSVSYSLDPATIQETAASAIAKLKEAGVTTVLFSGDPVAPRDFTREATAQEYFPEWIVGGSLLVDTNVFARTYDQQQWANAFGLSTLSARLDRSQSGAFFLYEWFNGEPPAADDTIGVIDPFPALFYAVLQGIGPELTIENWQQTIFAAEPTRRALTAPSISFGDEGRWPAELEPDYLGTDDITVIWWDPDQVGTDELGREAAGMYQFVDGGRRYLLGEFPEQPATVFDTTGAIAMYAEQPPDEAFPMYEPLAAAPD